jgi:nucleoside-diphosphate-sugar epimerase
MLSFGEGEPSQRVIPRLIRDVATGRSIDWISPDLRRDYLDADEAAAAMVHLLFTGAHGAVNVASGLAPSVREIARAVAQALKTDEPVMSASEISSSGPSEIRADITKLRRLGWIPSCTLEESLARLCQGTGRNHWSTRDQS